MPRNASASPSAVVLSASSVDDVGTQRRDQRLQRLAPGGGEPGGLDAGVELAAGPGERGFERLRWR